MMKRPARPLMISAGIAALAVSGIGAGVSLGAASTPKIVNSVIAAVPSHPKDDAPFFAVFSTNGPLKQSKDDEGTLRYPGGMGIDGPASMRIYETAQPHRHAGDRCCYAAEASSKVWDTIKVGHTYPVSIALSNDSGAPRVKQDRKVRTRTIEDAAAALGC